MRRQHPLLALLMLAALGVPAFAHDVWLLARGPEDGTPIGEGDLVQVSLRQGHVESAEPLARNERKLERLQAIGPGGEILDLPGLHGSRPAGVFRPSAEGSWVVVYEGNASLYRLPPERFESYLEEEGLDHVREARRRAGHEAREGRELVSRHLKTLVPVGRAGLGGPSADRPIGLAAELVLDRLGADTIELRLLLDGQPAADVLVELLALDASSKGQQARTTAEGVVTFSPASMKPGSELMAAAVLARPSRQPDAEWRTFFTTLTFSLGVAE